MPIEITIPRLGWNMDEGVFVAWLKNDGDAVKAGEPIFSLETDKAVQEIESLDSGTLRMLPSGPRPGETLPVGTVIAHIERADEMDLAGAGNWEEAEKVAHLGRIHRSSPSVFEWAETLTGRRRVPKGDLRQLKVLVA